MRAGKIRPQSGISDTWELVEETTVTVATNSYTFSNLSGNTDEVYRLVARFINDNASTNYYYIRPNADSGANYGIQILQGVSTTISALRYTAQSIWHLNYNVHAQNEMVHCDLIIYAKSGYARTTIDCEAGGITGTTVDETAIHGMVWNNTGTEITSLPVYSQRATGIGVGSYLALYKKVV